MLSRLSKLEAAFVAAWRVLNSPICKRIIVNTVIRPVNDHAHSKIPINTRNRFFTVRALVPYQQSRLQSMPPDWEGWKTADRIIVFHEADKAGPHLETYIVVNGTAYNIGVKRLTPAMMRNVSKNGGGKLTQNSQEYLINILRKEYKNGAWLAQTTDHTPSEARTSWTTRTTGVTGYGEGKSRHVLVDDRVVLFRTGQSIEYRDYTLNADKNSYVFRLMDAKNGRTRPILKLGFKDISHSELRDRLHLKAHIGIDAFEKFKSSVGTKGIVTLKEDGASFYFESNKQGTNIFSPRISKITGNRINYNDKVRDLINIKSDIKISGMGELNYIDKRSGKIITAHETGGLLNSNSILPDWAIPKLTIYRIDKLGKQDIHNQPYVENLAAILRFVSSTKNNKVVAPTVVKWADAVKIASQHEGLVGIPDGKSILDGRKFKPRHNEFDWTVTSVDLKPGDKGGIAGVVWFKSESGKQFKIGASSMGNREEAIQIMNNPDKYIDRVAKISSYKGHEGRAPRFVDWHDAKGKA